MPSATGGGVGGWACERGKPRELRSGQQAGHTGSGRCQLAVGKGWSAPAGQRCILLCCWQGAHLWAGCRCMCQSGWGWARQRERCQCPRSRRCSGRRWRRTSLIWPSTPPRTAPRPSSARRWTRLQGTGQVNMGGRVAQGVGGKTSRGFRPRCSCPRKPQRGQETTARARRDRGRFVGQQTNTQAACLTCWLLVGAGARGSRRRSGRRRRRRRGGSLCSAHGGAAGQRVWNVIRLHVVSAGGGGGAGKGGLG